MRKNTFTRHMDYWLHIEFFWFFNQEKSFQDMKFNHALQHLEKHWQVGKTVSVYFYCPHWRKVCKCLYIMKRSLFNTGHAWMILLGRVVRREIVSESFEDWLAHLSCLREVTHLEPSFWSINLPPVSLLLTSYVNWQDSINIIFIPPES